MSLVFAHHLVPLMLLFVLSYIRFDPVAYGSTQLEERFAVTIAQVQLDAILDLVLLSALISNTYERSART